MCFSFVGRLQTRLVTLVGPLLLTWIFAAASGNVHYWLLFSVMLGLSLVLDAGLYGWLIAYQPRWLTLLLAGFEFMLLKWIVEWPYPLEIRLRTRQALIFYLLCWLVIWITLHVLLPRCRARWVEENGQFAWTQRGRRWPATAQRQRMYGVAIASLALALCPWAVAAARTPANAIMTGLLVNEPGHLAELAAATAVMQGESWRSPAGAIGWLAFHGRWPVLPLYQTAWIVAGLAVLLVVQMVWPKMDAWRVLMLSMILVGMPLSSLIAAAGLSCLLANADLSRLLRLGRAQHWPHGWPSGVLSVGLVLGAVLSWSLAWSRVDRAPLLYIDHGTWQALTWLHQSTAVDTKVIAPPHLSAAITGLTGKAPARPATPGALELTSGARCVTEPVRFRHGPVCVVSQPQIRGHTQ